MNVILAKSAGFCFGVKRAVDTVYERILEKEPLYTFGPIIHNEEVVRDLEEKGVVVVNDVDELAGKPQGTVIIPGTRRGERCLRENTDARLFHRGRDLPVCVKDSPAGGALQWGGLSHCDRRECQPPGGERHQKLVECRGYARDRNPRRGRKIRCFPWEKGMYCITNDI